MFALVQTRVHINKRLKRPMTEAATMFGAPVIYMFDHCKYLKGEIEGWIEDPKTEKPVDGDDHLISCMLFMAARPRRYVGDYNMSVIAKERVLKRKVDPMSKY